MDYKEKYEQALERASKLRVQNPFDTVGQMVEHIFPELKEKESEDERIRKGLIKAVSGILKGNTLYGTDVTREEALTWLEKQGEKVTNINGEDWGIDGLYHAINILEKTIGRVVGYQSDDGILSHKAAINAVKELYKKQGEKKSTDNVKPKFKVGYLVVSNNNGEVWQIGARYTEEGQRIYLYNVNDVMMSITLDELNNDYHLWTIKDAKDGDVLASKGKGGQEIGIVKKFIGKYGGHNKCFETYCYSDLDGTFRIGEYMGGNTIHPATQKQCAQLFQKMKEAGYEWDSEKKELKKIEQKPVDKLEPKFKVGDWITDGHLTCKVLSVTGKSYELHLYNDDYWHFETDVQSVDKYYHLWTIQEAKDGDVLVCNINKAEIGGDIEKLSNITPTIFMYQNVVKDSDYIHSYCALYDESSLVLQNTMYYNEFVDNIHPATKEQRDLLFQKMKEAGCEWDNEKKELKKIETEFDGDNILLLSLGNNQVQDILEDMGMLDDNGRCPHTAEEIFKAGMEHAFNLNREAASSVKPDAKNR